MFMLERFTLIEKIWIKNMVGKHSFKKMKPKLLVHEPDPENLHIITT